MFRRFVVNASPLILLARIEQISLLDLLVEEVIVPEGVMEELRKGSGRDKAAAIVESLDWLRIVPNLPVPSEVQSWDLGEGESQVLAHALQVPGWEAVMDDRAARRCARVLAFHIQARWESFSPAKRLDTSRLHVL